MYSEVRLTDLKLSKTSEEYIYSYSYLNIGNILECYRFCPPKI